MKQIDELLDLLVQWPLVGLGIISMATGNMPLGMLLLVSPFILKRLPKPTTRDREEENNNGN